MKKNNFQDKKVVVALSGGVDSAVAAALLKKQEYDVMGVYIHFFGGPKDVKAAKRAKSIAKKLDVKFFEIDARKEFKKKIIGYFIHAHEIGLTPNPCVVCNKEMKFRLLLKLLKKYKADCIATGHYARVSRKTHNAKRITKKKLQVTSYELREALDKAKDQSYFLYRLNQKDLAKIIFPLGEYQKKEVKKIAKELKLPVAKEESQDVCFVDKDVNNFLRNNIKLISGNIIDEKRNILGKHNGLPLYTLGQRKGIEIGGSGPYFVLGKNLRKNELVVTNDPEKLLTRKFFIGKANWLEPNIKLPSKAQVQIRYHAPRISAIIKRTKPIFAKAAAGKNGLMIEVKKPLRAVTLGQSTVFYKGNVILGGGIIVHANSRE